MFITCLSAECPNDVQLLPKDIEYSYNRMKFNELYIAKYKYILTQKPILFVSFLGFTENFN